MDHLLPGGAWTGRGLTRSFALRPLTGHLEQGLLEGLARARTWPEAVSAALTAVVETLGEQPASTEQVEALCVGDRRFLLLQVAQLLHGDAFWSSARCTGCEAWFDLELRRSQVPVKAAGPGYPFSEVALDDGRLLRVRVPTGVDQQAVLALDDEAAAAALLERCLVAEDEAPAAGLAAALGPGERTRVEEALEALAPEVGTRVRTRCPECAAEQVLEVDPFGPERWLADRLYQEVHRLASTYHWSEEEILGLPRSRRRHYLGLIDLDRGLSR